MDFDQIAVNEVNSNKYKTYGMLPGISPGSIPVVSLWRRRHEFSGNVTTAYHGVRVYAGYLFSDTAFLTAPGYGSVFWKSESL